MSHQDLNEREEAEKVTHNLKGDWFQIAHYAISRCGDYVYDHQREAFLAEMLRAAAAQGRADTEPENKQHESRSPDGDGQSLVGRSGERAACAQVDTKQPQNADYRTMRPTVQSDQQTVGDQGHGGKPMTVNAGGRAGQEQGEPQLRRPRPQVAGSEPADSHHNLTSEGTPHAETGWRPIATAPKDGNWVMVFRGVIGIGYYFASVDGSSGWITRPCPNRATDGVESIEPPTHWMPLPLPPETGDAT